MNFNMDLKDKVNLKPVETLSVDNLGGSQLNKFDVDINRSGSSFEIFSLKKIKEISLFDQSGRVIKLGDRINDHKFSININVGFYKFLALMVKVTFDKGSLYKRIDKLV